jgi:hypothetical protein
LSEKHLITFAEPDHGDREGKGRRAWKQADRRALLSSRSRATSALQKAIKSRFPDVHNLLIEVQSEQTFAASKDASHVQVVGSAAH